MKITHAVAFEIFKASILSRYETVTMTQAISQAQEALIASVVNAKIKDGIALLDSWLHRHGVHKTLEELINPAIKEFGRLYSQDGHVNLTQGYVFSVIIEQCFLPFAESQEADDATHEKPSHKKQGVIVLGNVEGDFHALGRRMVGTLARLNQWEVVDLGVNVLANEFVDAAMEHNATIIGVSAMTYTNAKKIPIIRQVLSKNHLENQIRLAVGGAIFALNPKLAEKVEADGTASNAVKAIELFNYLKQPKASNNDSLTEATARLQLTPKFANPKIYAD